VKGEGRRIAVEENGARYIADLTEGQKTGWYYDQRDNRAFIAALRKGKTCWTPIPIPAASASWRQGRRQGSRVLGFLGARAGLAEESARANGVTINAVKADVFEELERLKAAGERFDIVLADPPPL
jgi:23S rRNA (cytosine1962-C5)-methyltransferase